MRVRTNFFSTLIIVVLSFTLLLFLTKEISYPQGTGLFIKNVVASKCIDVTGTPGKSNGSPLQLWDCELSGTNSDNNSKTDQQWKIDRKGFIRNVLSDKKCIDVLGAPGQDNGSPLQLWDCELSGFNSDNGETTDQQWKIERNGFIKNTNSKKCIDVLGAPGQDNGSPLQLWDCELSGRNSENGSITDQIWCITGRCEPEV
ncbi:RICIN domain-containing protein [Nostoc sp. XA013]|nr:RICIN domain-containing protein [Nostoc sp. XA013]